MAVSMDLDKFHANTKAYPYVRIAMIAVAHWHSLEPLLVVIVVSSPMLPRAVDGLTTSWQSSYRVVFGAECIKFLILLGTHTADDQVANQAPAGMIIHALRFEKRNSRN